MIDLSHKPMRAFCAIEIAALLLSGCATPNSSYLKVADRALLTPLAVTSVVSPPNQLVGYQQTDGSIGAPSSPDGMVAFVLLLPVIVVAEVGIATSNTAKANRAAQMSLAVGEHWRAVPMDAVYESELRGALASLPWLTLVPAPDTDLAAAGGIPPEATLDARTTFALIPDSGRLLVRMQLEIFSSAVESDFDPFACGHAAPGSELVFCTRLYFMSESFTDQQWAAQDGTRVRDTLIVAAQHLAALAVRALEDSAPPARHGESMGTILFPYFYDSHYGALVGKEGTNLIIRTNTSPTLGAQRLFNRGAGMWLDVPISLAAGDVDASVDMTFGSEAAMRFAYVEPGPGAVAAKQRAADVAANRELGTVWVDSLTHTYYCKDASHYGTKSGQYMTQEQARKAGIRPSYGKLCR